VTGAGRDETEAERLERNLEELLGELRVALLFLVLWFALPARRRATRA
jgi:hypothetical protein